MLLPRERWIQGGAARNGLARMLYAATGLPTWAAVLAAFGAIVALAVADHALGPPWSLGLFYYLPIAFAAWRLGGTGGVVASIVSAAAWASVGLSYGTLPAEGGPIAWAFVSRALSFAIGALLVAEMRRMFERERGLARHDHLTGALSGRAFRDVLDAEVARVAGRGGRSLALVFTDLDDFKQINDRAGHAAGDEMLRCFVEAAGAGVGAGGHVARIGGDEFVMLLVGDAASRAAVVRLNAGIAAALAGAAHPISATMGAILVPAGAREEAGALVRRADSAMYEAKRQGKGGLCVFELGQRSALSVAA